ncbi:DUF4476 domain-containing protein [Pontibacter harenae]|uniref:DUF4476 domain-containing protein n=1 Tax=Pontibacter harenae TaxID=2894083 RepID=UPI001E305D38|nr:DUF4476 domain-containing protein [Pontibacter harenae]MCC9165293.1 DUF4476 domain-containing protein [Pontibacter harenae]
MKKLLLLPLLLVLLVLPASLQASVITFATRHGEPFQVRLNGEIVNHRATNFIRIDHLRPGQHYVEFKVMGPRGVYRMGTNITAAVGYERNFGLRVTGRRGRVAINLLSQVPLVPPVVVPDPMPAPVPVPLPPRYPDQGPINPENPYHNPNDRCRNLLTSYDMDRLIESMKSRSFESTRLSIAREALRNASILSEDLKFLLDQFEYESTRLEYAKFAYDYVCDKERFYYVYDALKFDMSVRELEEYTRRR